MKNIDLQTIQTCARDAFDLSEAINKLNIGLFGVKVIEDKIQRFSESCNISEEDLNIIKREIDDGVDYYRNKEYDTADRTFSTASMSVLLNALSGALPKS